MLAENEIDKHEEFWFDDGDLVLLVGARPAIWPKLTSYSSG